MTDQEKMQQLEGRAEWWERKAKSLEARIEELEDKKARKHEARAERQERQDQIARSALQGARIAAIRELVKLLPQAVAQAKAKPPRPALLRMILRATR